MADDPRKPEAPAPTGLPEKQGGEHDVAADVSPPAASPAPDYAGHKTGDGAPERAGDRPGGMGGEG